MTELLPELIYAAARRNADAPAVEMGEGSLSYGALADLVDRAADGLLRLSLGRSERVAVYLEKRFEALAAKFGAARAGGVFVPVNPLLKARQVEHILKDCNVRVLVTSTARVAALGDALARCHDLFALVLVDGAERGDVPTHIEVLSWQALVAPGAPVARHRVIDRDMAAILYTSGSTGLPKGVVLSHRNVVAGAKSVSQYLENTETDRVLSVLPLSFDAGFSQVTTMFNVGGTVVLLNYLLPRDVVAAVADKRITGLGGVPPLWNQLAELDWPDAAVSSLRYFTNTGGHMPRATLEKLCTRLPKTSPYLMYGLTEAFRSTYLPPSEVDRRPDSMGKAIPNEEVLVVRETGELAAPGEPGELVHRGALVAMGYWNDPERTAQRFRPAPGRDGALCVPETAVWSGDTVRMDADGFLYFIGRRDEMIKTSGYRVSPTEIEEVLYGSGGVGEAAAIGVPHETLGQEIVAIVTPNGSGPVDGAALLAHCRREMPPFMVPHAIVERASLPRNANGKIDRKVLAQQLAESHRATPAEAEA